MNLYLAAVYANNYRQGQNRYQKLNDRERQIFDTVPHDLESYHYVKRQEYVDAMRANGAKVFLDSGAFSATSLGVEIDIEQYCQYIERNRDIIYCDDNITMASVLDGIGDPLLTYQNQIYMEKRGVTPVPCFHMGEDERYLDWYIDNYEYISLGGLVGAGPAQLIQWLDRIWGNHLLDNKGNPKLKVHGFGITSIPIMERYPWHSCDSSSWIQAAAFGSVFTAAYGPIACSSKSPARHTRNQHLTNFSEIETQHIIQYLQQRGFNYERLSTIYESRAACSCQGYIELGQLLNEARDKSREFLAVQRLF